MWPLSEQASRDCLPSPVMWSNFHLILGDLEDMGCCRERGGREGQRFGGGAGDQLHSLVLCACCPTRGRRKGQVDWWVMLV